MARKQEKVVFVNKQPGETPLEALERYRKGRADVASEPMTYAGRLDPMASGTLLVLIGDECKNKDKYLALDKEYEIEVLFGISTDTYDALGMAVLGQTKEAFDTTKIDLTKYVGKITQEYPAYSSKTVDGVQLHELARTGKLPEEMPTNEVEIYSIEKLGEATVSAGDLKKEIAGKIKMVLGDFRQKEILAKWDEVLANSAMNFGVMKLKVKCSSGTYMRSIAHRMGKDAGVGAFALTIKRTKIFLK